MVDNPNYITFHHHYAFNLLVLQWCGMGYENYVNQTESFISPLSEYGMLRSSDRNGGVWLYGLVKDAEALSTSATNGDRLNANSNLLSFFNALGGMVNAGVSKYRNLLQDWYREYHILATAMPAVYQPPLSMRGTRLYSFLSDTFTGVISTRRKIVVVGVRLRPGGKPRKKTSLTRRILTSLDNLAFNIHNRISSFDDYLADMNRIATIMDGANIIPMSAMSDGDRMNLLHRLKTWWMPRGDMESLPVITENDHLHFFPGIDSCQTAQRLYDKGVDCEKWNLPSEYPASLFFVKSSQFQESPVTDPSNLWVARLLSDWRGGGCDALGVSIRGRVEPATVTGHEILRNKNTIRDAVRHRAEHNREATNDQEELEAELDYKQRIYNQKNMPATLIDTSVCVAMAGKPEEARNRLNSVSDITFVNRNTAIEQLIAFKSMQVCSPIRMIPYELHWSSTVVSGAGLASLAQAGDGKGAFLGLTETDRQPVYLNPHIVQEKDEQPILTVVGQTGSGKTMLLMDLALQWSTSVPVIYLDPKQNSDLSAGVAQFGGKSYSMDKDLSQGMFDPLAVMDSQESAINMSTHMLTSILFEGDTQKTVKEATLRALISWGVKHDCHSTGFAVVQAAQAMRRGDTVLAGLDKSVVVSVVNTLVTLTHNDPLLPLLCSMNPTPDRLGVRDGLTYFKAGRMNLNPPSDADMTLTGRLQQWVLRMAVIGMGQAVMGRGGVVILDEAWMALGKGSADVVSEWGRLARSQNFTPVLGSQKIDKFIDAGLAGAINRILILAMDKMTVSGVDSPSTKALKLAGINDETGYFTRRLPQDSMIGTGAHAQPNWDSVRALPASDGHPPRGSVCVFKDHGKSPVMVENVIDPKILYNISTHQADVERRKEDSREQ